MIKLDILKKSIVGDLISVTPLKEPTGLVYYLDYKYKSTDIYNELIELNGRV